MIMIIQRSLITTTKNKLLSSPCEEADRRVSAKITSTATKGVSRCVYRDRLLCWLVFGLLNQTAKCIRHCGLCSTKTIQGGANMPTAAKYNHTPRHR